MVFVREAVTDHAGGADFRLPYGVYDLLVSNPRQGQYARVERLVSARSAPPEMSREVVVRGTSTDAQRAAWRAELLQRAEHWQRLWAY